MGIVEYYHYMVQYLEYPWYIYIVQYCTCTGLFLNCEICAYFPFVVSESLSAPVHKVRCAGFLSSLISLLIKVS